MWLYSNGPEKLLVLGNVIFEVTRRIWWTHWPAFDFWEIQLNYLEFHNTCPGLMAKIILSELWKVVCLFLQWKQHAAYKGCLQMLDLWSFPLFLIWNTLCTYANLFSFQKDSPAWIPAHTSCMIGHSPREMLSSQAAWRRFTYPIHMLHDGNSLQRVLWSTLDSNNLESRLFWESKLKIWFGCLDRKKISFCAVRLYEPLTSSFLHIKLLIHSFNPHELTPWVISVLWLLNTISTLMPPKFISLDSTLPSTSSYVFSCLHNISKGLPNKAVLIHGISKSNPSSPLILPTPNSPLRSPISVDEIRNHLVTYAEILKVINTYPHIPHPVHLQGPSVLPFKHAKSSHVLPPLLLPL